MSDAQETKLKIIYYIVKVRVLMVKHPLKLYQVNESEKHAK